MLNRGLDLIKMKIIYLLVLLYCLNAALDYPTACDCTEHSD